MFIFRVQMDAVARSVIDVIKESVILLIDTFSEYPGCAEVTDLGRSILDGLEKISDKIGIVDIRVHEVAIEDKLDAFSTRAAEFDRENGDKNKINLKHLQIHIKSLSRTLSQEWNSGLPKEDNSATSQQDQEDASAKTEDLEDNVQKSPEKIPIPKVFEKFTPLHTKMTRTCGICGLTFGYRSLINHLKDQHKDESAENFGGEEEKVPHPVGTCKMPDKKNPTIRCNRQFPSFGIKRHLKEYHGVNCPPEPLRGFSSDDGGASWEPVFLRKADPDPQYDVLIQLVQSPNPEADTGDIVAEVEDIIVDVNPVEPEKEKEKSRRKLFSSPSPERREDTVDLSEEEDNMNVDVNYEKKGKKS